jgi:hypothetical protein
MKLALLVGLVLVPPMISGCGLQAAGVYSPPIDPDFRGCFASTAPPTGEIQINQHDPDLLAGTGRGVFDSDFWGFTGSVLELGRARLTITTEGSVTFVVEATRAGGTLILRRDREAAVTLRSAPCS